MSQPMTTRFMTTNTRNRLTAASAVVLAALLLGQASLTPARAQARPEPPSLLSFQGTLVAADGTLIGATQAVNYPMVFRIFDNDVGGELLWSEQQTVSVFKGAFSVMLGEGNTFGNESRPELSSVFQSSNASDRFVEVTVRGTGAGEAEATLAPRTRLLSAPYAFVVAHTRTAQDMVNLNGQAMLVPAGDKVGVNKANPQASLDVAESILARGMEVRETMTVTGVGEATGFDGLGMAPVGSVILWTGTTPPKGWVLCDGAVVAGVTTPDLRGRFILGAGAGPGLTPRTLAQRGGVEAHALAEAEMPAHSHSVSFNADSVPMGTGRHAFRVSNQGDTVYGWIGPFSGSRLSHLPHTIGPTHTDHAGDHNHQYTLPTTVSSLRGSGRPHNTMPPFYALAFIMRVQ